MPTLRFSEWIPDQAAMNGGHIPLARNVLPQAQGYGPFKSPVLDSAGAFPGNKPQGRIYTFQDGQGNFYSFVGDNQKLYRRSISGSYTDVSRETGGNYTTPTDDQWRMVQWGNNVYAVNNFDAMQVFTLGASSKFSDVDIGVSATFRQIFIVQNQLVGVGVKESGTSIGYRIRWSALGNPEDWTPSAETLAGFRDLNDLGNIQGGVGGEQGLLAMEKGAIRMTFLGAPNIFAFDAVERSPGCVEPNSVVIVKQDLAYLSEHGWIKFNGTLAESIGTERVDRWFDRNLDKNYQSKILMNVPEDSTMVYISFPGPGNTDGQPNNTLIIDYAINRWSYVTMPLDSIGIIATPATLSDDITDMCDDIFVFSDSPIYRGGEPFDAIIYNGNTYGLQGPPLEATLDTEEIPISDTLTTHRIYPLVTGGECTITAQVGVRRKANETPVFGPACGQARNGSIPCRGSGKFMSTRLKITGEWIQAVGAELDPPRRARV